MLEETHPQAQNSKPAKEPLLGFLLNNLRPVFLQEGLALQDRPGHALDIPPELKVVVVTLTAGFFF